MITEIIFIRDFKRPLSAFHVVDHNMKDACVLALLVRWTPFSSSGAPFSKVPKRSYLCGRFSNNLFHLSCLLGGNRNFELSHRNEPLKILNSSISMAFVESTQIISGVSSFILYITAKGIPGYTKYTHEKPPLKCIFILTKLCYIISTSPVKFLSKLLCIRTFHDYCTCKNVVYLHSRY